MLRKQLLILFAFAVSVSSFAQDRLSTEVSRDSILIGDQFEWTLSLRLSENEKYCIEELVEPFANGLESIRPYTIETSNKKDSIDVEWKMILTSFDSGSWQLPNMTVLIAHTDGVVDTLLYEGPTIEVNTIPIDTATFTPYDIKGQINYPVTFAEATKWVLLLFLVIAIALIIIRAIKTRRENRTFFGKPIIAEPPHIIALRGLEKIRSQKLWQNDKQKQFYTSVTDTLRQYITDRYEISAFEKTTKELFNDLEQEVPDKEILQPIKDLFATADFVKFAKHKASLEENEEAIPTAVRFVNATFMQKIEEDNIKEKEE